MCRHRGEIKVIYFVQRCNALDIAHITANTDVIISRKITRTKCFIVQYLKNAIFQSLFFTKVYLF